MVVSRSSSPDGSPLELLFSNDFFGEESVVHNKLSCVSVRTLTYTELAALSKSDYESTIARFPILSAHLPSLSSACVCFGKFVPSFPDALDSLFVHNLLNCGHDSSCAFTGSLVVHHAEKQDTRRRSQAVRLPFELLPIAMTLAPCPPTVPLPFLHASQAFCEDSVWSPSRTLSGARQRCSLLRGRSGESISTSQKPLHAYRRKPIAQAKV